MNSKPTNYRSKAYVPRLGLIYFIGSLAYTGLNRGKSDLLPGIYVSHDGCAFKLIDLAKSQPFTVVIVGAQRGPAMPRVQTRDIGGTKAGEQITNFWIKGQVTNF